MSETLAVLKSIDQSLRTLVTIAQRKAEERVKSAASTPPSGGQKIASDSDLDGQYGDPVIKAKDPRDWSGPSMVGLHFSDCPADYLDLVAERLDYFAEKAEAEDKRTSSGKPVAPFNRSDAARARGWAERIRSGKHKPAARTEDEGWA